jgi:hypothetical protein
VTALADLHLELLRRNARLRAWRAVGVPVEGGWSEPVYTPADGGFYGLFASIFCAICVPAGERFKAAPWLHVSASGHVLRPVGYDLQPVRQALLNRERELLEARLHACSHLAPLLGDDPPEVLAILELELLAGEGPR